MSAPPDRLPHFKSSLSALARVAFQETKATGFALFHKTDEAPGLLRVAALGSEISPRALLRDENLPLVGFPLHTGGEQDGLVAFSFQDRAASARALEPLNRLREAIEIIWAARRPDARYFDLVTGISTLEARLIDSKIADRAQGLLAGERGSDLLDSMVRHVKTVVRPGMGSRTLESILKELEDELEERRVTGQAKALLQATHSLSENQAYTHLRVLSRKSRRPLKDVAMDVIATIALTTSAA
jgi:AmiR/NasT family two-component response regulator